MNNLLVQVTRYSNQKSYEIKPGGTVLDNLGHPINFLDKIIYPYSRGNYQLGYYLGTTTSGKNIRLLSFYSSDRVGYIPNLDIETVSRSEQLLKVDWSTDKVPPDLDTILNLLREGQTHIQLG